MLGDLLNAQSLAEPLREALGHLAQLSEQRDEHVAALEAMCGDLSTRFDAQGQREAELNARLDEHAKRLEVTLLARMDAQRTSFEQREALLLSRIEALEEARRADEAVRPREDFSPTLRARLVQPSEKHVLMDDFVLVDLPTTPFGSPESEAYRSSLEPVQEIVAVPTVFAIQRAPLVWEQWARVLQRSSDHPTNEPVQGVLVWSIFELCNRLSELDGLESCYQLIHEPDGQPLSVRFLGLGRSGYRIPLSIEWEAAARAGQSGPRYGEVDQIAWHARNSMNQYHGVGQLQPNGLGLHDMLGNVNELVWADIEQEQIYFKASATARGRREATTDGLVSCGGSRFYAPVSCRFSLRGTCALARQDRYLGVRLVRTVEVRNISQTRE